MTAPHRAAVLGRPVAHSLSPVLHQAAYRALGLDWSYEAIDCGADELAAVLAARSDWVGFSCTMPLKHAALAVASEVRPRAVAVGAANTLLRNPGGWTADNTDVTGMIAALREAVIGPDGADGADGADRADGADGAATVLGGGGTAQAAVVALAELGFTAATALVRSEPRADSLRETARASGLRLTVEPLRVGAAALAADVVISTLPAGAADSMAGVGEGARPPWRPGQTVLDVVYDPWPTALGIAAGRGGSTVVSGAVLLLHQAAAQVELMTGQPAPVAAMRAALRAAAPAAGL